jgi:hypothetical protein
MYADWKSQVAYSSPNWNGFSFTAGVTQAWNAGNTLLEASSTNSSRGGSEPAFEGKASYAWAGDFAGKVWVSGITQKMEGLSVASTGGTTNDRAEAFDIGANVNVAGFGLTGYYYNGSGIGQTVQFRDGFDKEGQQRDSDGYYVQATYTIPGVGTKIGASWGESNIDGNAIDTDLSSVTDSMWTLGAYHPLTKHLNLVAEYSDVKHEYTDKVAANSGDAHGRTVSLGAILFF